MKVYHCLEELMLVRCDVWMVLAGIETGWVKEGISDRKYGLGHFDIIAVLRVNMQRLALATSQDRTLEKLCLSSSSGPEPRT